MVKSLSEDLKLGFALNSFDAGAVDYDDGWVGRNFITEDKFFVLNIEPALALRVTDWLSVGVGINVLYGQLDLEFRSTPLDFTADVRVDEAEGWATGYMIGALVEPRDGTRIGLVYRGETELELDSALQNPTGTPLDLDLTLTFPQGINVGLFQELTPEWALLLDAGWSEWSSFGYIPVTLGPKTIHQERQWDDTWRIGAGTQYQLTDNLLVRTGFSYDSAPVPPERLLPDLPVFDAYRYSGGFEYTMNEHVTLSLNYTYVDFGDTDVNSVALPPTGSVILDGEYSSANIHTIGIVAKLNLDSIAKKLTAKSVPAPARHTNDVIAKLELLSELRNTGVLTEGEYQAQRKRLSI